MVCCEPFFYWSFRRNNPVRGFLCLFISHFICPQVALVPGLYPLDKTPSPASSLPPTLSPPCWKWAAIRDSHWPMAWMSSFAVVKVTDNGAGMSPSAQVCLSCLGGGCTPTPCFFFLRTRNIYNSWCTPGRMQLQYSFFLCFACELSVCVCCTF